MKYLLILLGVLVFAQVANGPRPPIVVQGGANPMPITGAVAAKKGVRVGGAGHNVFAEPGELPMWDAQSRTPMLGAPVDIEERGRWEALAEEANTALRAFPSRTEVSNRIYNRLMSQDRLIPEEGFTPPEMLRHSADRAMGQDRSMAPLLAGREQFVQFLERDVVAQDPYETEIQADGSLKPWSVADAMLEPMGQPSGSSMYTG